MDSVINETARSSSDGVIVVEVGLTSATESRSTSASMVATVVLDFALSTGESRGVEGSGDSEVLPLDAIDVSKLHMLRIRSRCSIVCRLPSSSFRLHSSRRASAVAFSVSTEERGVTAETSGSSEQSATRISNTRGPSTSDVGGSGIVGRLFMTWSDV